MSLATAPLDVAVEGAYRFRGREPAGVTRSAPDTAEGGAVSGLPCRTLDPDLWFADSPAGLELAKSLCAACPVRAECLSGAVERAEPWGVWGGEIFERGAVVPRKRPRGRPRKEDVALDAVMRVEVAARTAALVAATVGDAALVAATAA